jgi:CRISPR associated protein
MTTSLTDLHLTKITIDYKVPYLQELISNPNKQRRYIDRIGIHKYLSEWFASPGDGGRFRQHYQILWRVDAISPHSGTILMSSRVRPDPWICDHRFPEQNFVTRTIEQPKQGQLVHFKIALQPMIRAARTRQESPVPPEQHQAWIHDLLTRRAGLEITEPIRITHPPIPSSMFTINSELRHASGIAVIGNANDTEQALRNGIGRRRPYGAGMLSLKAAKNTQ